MISEGFPLSRWLLNVPLPCKYLRGHADILPRVKPCAVICSWQRCVSGMKLLEDLCLYVSVPNNSVFAQQGFFCTVMSRRSPRPSCAIIVESFDLYIRPRQQPWKLHSVSLALIPRTLENYPPGNKGFAFHIHHCLHDKAMQRRSRKYIRALGEKTPVDSLPFTEKSNQTHRSNYTQTTHADGNCEVQMRSKGHRFPKGADRL